MFDKITIRASLSSEECVHLAHLHRLHVWVNEAATQTEYRSGEYAKLTGIEVKIIRNKLTLKTSLHKFWNSRNYGLLRNDNIFTVSEAKSAFEMLLFENGLVPEKTRIVQFELGLNMNVRYDPLTFIDLAQFVSLRDKLMFIDANFELNRQKTTMKHRNLRKYYKIYDKGFEMLEKRRTPPDMPPGGGDAREGGILRIETVYRRHNERASSFFTDKNMQRLTERFYADWRDLFFRRSVQADKGSRKSEIERAGAIINIGAEEYLQGVKEEFDRGKITPKQYRTIREFVRDYEENRNRFKTVISPQETEYKNLLYNTFIKAKE